MRNFSKIILHALIVLLITFTMLFIFTIPYFFGEKYYYQDYKVRKNLSGQLDTLVVGSSHALRSVKPTILNEELNVKSYNLSSPLMSMYGRLYLLSKEIKRNDINTVIFELSYNALTLDRKTLGLEGDLYVLGRLDNSIDRLKFFSNAFYKEEYFKVFSDTIDRSKNAMTTKKSELVQKETYGYIPLESEDFSLTNEEKLRVVNSDILDTEIKEENLKYFNDIISLCKENNIRVILVVVPVTEKMMIKYYNSDDLYNQYKKLASDLEVEYYDFNLDTKRKELYSEVTSFYDETHMSDEGASIFTKRLSDVINGEEILFYDSYKEYKKTILD